MKSCEHKWFTDTVPYSRLCLNCGTNRLYKLDPSKKDKKIYLSILKEYSELQSYFQKEHNFTDRFTEWFILDTLEQLSHCK